MDVAKARKGQVRRHDAKYECVIKKPTKKIVLKSVTYPLFMGELRWAWVPRGKRLIRMQVLVTDEPVKNLIIENVSTKT